jgi:hypothetical protein
MNLVVALCSALTAMVLYFVVVNAAKLFIGIPDTLHKRLTLCIGGVVGGLFAAFGYTFWFSAVETSVYNLSMLNIAICTLLMLKWAQSKRADRDKLLILVAFLGFLGIGLHMYTMIIFPSAFLFMIMWDEKKRRDWRLWGTGIVMAAVIYSLSKFLWLGPLTMVLTFIMSMASKEHKAEWRLCFFFALFAIIGYSVHIFIPIRSALEPIINENHPATLEAFIGFLERKQYGSESMITRMFWRRGEWGNQFGIEEHMGYGGFHITQFFRFAVEDTGESMFRHGFIPGISQLVLYLIPTAFMLYGWSYLYKRNRSAAIFLITLTLVTTIGMVLYMNFADGKRPERLDYEQWARAGQAHLAPNVHREVRVRDYFFTAGFMYFGMWIGLAACCLLHALFTSKDKFARTVMATTCAVLLAISPVLPAVVNFKLSTRAGDWVAFDYAYNLLNSCEPYGIIFTNGDNDTFPLWALQEAYGIRNDVRVVNLSLLNTDWYIEQLRKLYPRVPMTFTEEDVSRMTNMATFIESNRNRFTGAPVRLRNSGITIVPPSSDERRVLRVQDRMIINILEANAWQKPMYFARTVSDDNLMGLAPYLRAEGLVYRIVPEPLSDNLRHSMRALMNMEDHYNFDRKLALVDSIYSFKGIGAARRNDTSRRLLTNYLQIAFDLRMLTGMLRIEVETLRREAEAAAGADGKGTDATDAYGNVIAAASAAANVQERFERVQREYEEKRGIVLRFLERCTEMIWWDLHPREIRHHFFIDHDMFDEAISAMERAIAEDPANSQRYSTMLDQARAMKGVRE